MKKNSSIKHQFSVIPPNSFVVFTSRYMNDLLEAIGECEKLFSERNIAGIVLDEETKLEVLSESDLARAGLKRIPRMDLQ